MAKQLVSGSTPARKNLCAIHKLLFWVWVLYIWNYVLILAHYITEQCNAPFLRLYWAQCLKITVHLLKTKVPLPFKTYYRISKLLWVTALERDIQIWVTVSPVPCQLDRCRLHRFCIKKLGKWMTVPTYMLPMCKVTPDFQIIK